MYNSQSQKQQRSWASLAHLSILLNLVTLILGTISAGAIYLYYRKRSPFVAFHALQAFFFQLIFWIGGWIAAIAVFILAKAAGDIGICLMLFGFLLALVPLASLVYAMLASFLVRRGEDFEYPRIGERVLDYLNRE